MHDCIVSTTNTRQQVYCVVSNGYLIGWLLAQRKVEFENFKAGGACMPQDLPHPPGRPTPTQSLALAMTSHFYDNYE